MTTTSHYIFEKSIRTRDGCHRRYLYYVLYAEDDDEDLARINQSMKINESNCTEAQNFFRMPPLEWEPWQHDMTEKTNNRATYDASFVNLFLIGLAALSVTAPVSWIHAVGSSQTDPVIKKIGTYSNHRFFLHPHELESKERRRCCYNKLRYRRNQWDMSTERWNHRRRHRQPRNGCNQRILWTHCPLRRRRRYLRRGKKCKWRGKRLPSN